MDNTPSTEPTTITRVATPPVDIIIAIFISISDVFIKNTRNHKLIKTDAHITYNIKIYIFYNKLKQLDIYNINKVHEISDL